MRLIILSALLYVLIGCAAPHRESRSPTSQDKSMRLEGTDVAGWLDNPNETFAMAQKAPSPMVGRKMSALRADQAGGAMEEDEVTQDAVQEDSPNQPRMVFHEGWLHLRSTDPTTTLDSATKFAQSLGGYVESRNKNSTVLRIPVQVFRANFDQFANLATLLRKEIRTDDITDQFLDNELRLRVAKETLERLQTLLAESLNPQEKLQLLREIQRLSKQIELQEATKRDLEKKAAFSRLNLTVDPFIFQGVEREEPIGAFRWITSLRPQRLNEVRDGKPLELKSPSGFVSLSLDKSLNYWAAAANDGSEFWAHRKQNEPKGDAAFWSEVIRLRIGKTFSKTDVREAKAWKIVLVTSFDSKPYTWMIAVRTQENDLDVAEAFFPNPSALQANLEQVIAVLQEGNP